MEIVKSIYLKSFIEREKNSSRRTIVFDLDNTLFCEMGKFMRPGIIPVLESLKKGGFKLVIWTNSTVIRAVSIIRGSQVEKYFDMLIARESYDLAEIKKIDAALHKRIIAEFPQEAAFQNRFEGAKNLSLLGYGVLIDDDPAIYAQATYWRNAYKTFACECFRTEKPLEKTDEMKIIAGEILSPGGRGLLGRLKRLLKR